MTNTCHMVSFLSDKMFAVEWCQEEWIANMEYQSNNLVDNFVYGLKRDKKLSKTIQLNNIHYKPLTINMARLVVNYKPPVKESYFVTYADSTTSTSLRIHSFGSTCLTFKFKLKGRGFAHIAIRGYVSRSGDTFHDILAFYLNDIAQDEWINVSIPTWSPKIFHYIYVFPLVNGIGTGFVAVADIKGMGDSCSLSPTYAIHPKVTFQDINAILQRYKFPLPLIVIPKESRRSNFTALSNLNISIKINSSFKGTSFQYYDYIPSRIIYAIHDTPLLKRFTLALWYKKKGLIIKLFNGAESSGAFLTAIQTSDILMGVTAGTEEYSPTSNHNYWHHLVFQYDHQIKELKIFLDQKQVYHKPISLSADEHVQISSLDVGIHTICIQLYDKILDETELAQTRLCPHRHSVKACLGYRSCMVCNQFTGEWERRKSQEQFLDENCRMVFNSSDVELYFPMDVVTDDFIEDVQNVNNKIQFNSSIMTVIKVGVVNQALCVKSDSDVVLLKDPNVCSSGKCTVSMWLKHTCDINSTKMIFANPLIKIICNGTSNSNAVKFLYKDCYYKALVKHGLWYHLSISFGDRIHIYVNGDEISYTKQCNDVTDTAEAKNFAVGASSHYNCFDEMIIYSLVKSADDVKELYNTTVFGLKNDSLTNLKYMVAPVYVTVVTNEYKNDIKKIDHSFHSMFGKRVNSLFQEKLSNLSIGNVYAEDTKKYYSCQSMNAIFALYFDHLTESKINQLLAAFNSPEYSFYFKITNVKLLIDDCNQVAPVNTLSRLRTVSISATYEILKTTETSVVLKFNDIQDVPDKQPITSLFVMVESLQYGTRYQLIANNTHYIVIGNLKPFEEHRVCFLPTFLHAELKISNCKFLSKTFKTVESTPIAAPKFSCSPTPPDKMVCSVKAIKASEWNGQPFSYQLLYVSTSELQENQFNTSVNNWNFSRFESYHLSVCLCSTDMVFKTPIAYQNFSIVVRATTKYGTGFGVASMYFIRSYPGPPEEKVRNLTARYEESQPPPMVENGANSAGGDGISSTNLSSIFLTWAPLDNNPEIWNFPNTSGTYQIKHGFFDINALYSSLNDISNLQPLNNTNNTNSTNDTNSTNNTNSTNSTSSFNATNENKHLIHQVVYNELAVLGPVKTISHRITAPEHNEVYAFTIAAVSTEVGLYDAPVCLMLPFEKPKLIPHLAKHRIINSTSAIVTIGAFKPVSWHGDKKYFQITAVPVDPANLNYKFIKYIKDITFQYNIEEYRNTSQLCNVTQIERYLMQFYRKQISVQLDNLDHYTDYRVSFQSCNEKGCGKASHVAFKTNQYIPTCVPSNITVQNKSSTSVVVNWLSLSLVCAHGIITGYNLHLVRSRTGEQINKTVATANPVVFDQLEKYEQYCVTVVAFTVKGLGPVSKNMCVHTAEDAPCLIPFVKKTVITATSVLFKVISKDVYQMNGLVRGVNIFYQFSPIMVNNGTSASNTTTNATSLNQTILLPPKPPCPNVVPLMASEFMSKTFSLDHEQFYKEYYVAKFLIADLKFFTYYDFYLQYFTSAGVGEWKKVVKQTRQGIPRFPPVLNMTTNSRNALIFWQALEYKLWTGIPLRYELTVFEYLRNGTTRNSTFFIDPKNTTFLKTNLEPYTTCSVIIIACTIVGCCQPTNGTNLLTLEEVPIGYSKITKFDKTSTSISVQWDKVPIMKQYGKILSYQLTINADYNFPRVINISGLYQSYTFRNLSHYHWYNITIKAKDSKGFGPSLWYLNRTKEDTPILPPFNVTTMEHSGQSLIVYWEDILHDGKSGILRGFVIFYNEILQNGSLGVTQTKKINGGQVFSHELTGLSFDGQYNISVAGFTSVGVGVKSNVVMGKTGDYVNGNWSLWTTWSYCSASCGGGISKRVRLCNNPVPFNGGFSCKGDWIESKSCNEVGCSGYYLSDDTNCTSFCTKFKILCSTVFNTRNTTSIFRTKIGVNCSTDESHAYYRRDYHPAYNSKNEACIGYRNTPHNVPCVSSNKMNDPDLRKVCHCEDEYDIGFSEWAVWSPCSTTCGVSTKIRQRRCIGECTGKSVNILNCYVEPCPVDGMWGNWTELSPCNKTCGYGYQFRYRECKYPAPTHGGKDCPGPSEDVIKGCNVEPCPIHGGITSWGNWSLCEEPCGESTRTRIRYCTNPVPRYRGQFCTENLIDTMKCFQPECKPIDVQYNVRFTDEIWDYKLFYIKRAEAQPLIKKIIQSIYTFYSNSSIISFIIIESFSRGSVIAEFTVRYKYVNSDQVVQLTDAMTYTGNLTSMPVGAYSVNSTTIPCSPPTDIVAIPFDMITVNLTWTIGSCPSNMEPTNLYIFFSPVLNTGQVDLGNRSWKVQGILHNTSWIVITDLVPAIVYKAYMLQSTVEGNGPPSKSILIETPVGPPGVPPPNVTAVSTKSEVIYVEWNDIPFLKRNGPLTGYKVRYKKYFDKEFKVKNIDFGFTTTDIKGLKPYTLYWIQISGYNAAGEGPTEYAIVETLQGAPAIPVPNFKVNDMESISWWSVSWSAIPDEFANGILLGYRLFYYQTFRSGIEVGGEKDIIVREFDKFTFFYKATNLLNYAIYNVTVTGFTQAGNGPRPEFYAKTCNCLEHLYAAYYINPPYSNYTDSGKLGGLFPGLLHDIIIKACGSCKPYAKSVLHYYTSKIGANPEKLSEHTLRTSITAETDLYFPIYGQAAREVLAPNSLFVQLVESPGCAVVVRDEAKLAGAVDKMILGVLNVWPLLLISYGIATIFGQLVWFFDQFQNSEEFSVGSSVRGPCIGFWFSFVTMTTMGYGDLTPRSIMARSIAMVWFLTGLVLNGIIIGFITTSLTSFGLPKEIKLYDTKTAALDNSFEYRYAVLRNAKVSKDIKYNDIMSMLNALERNEVDAVLIDTYSMASMQSVLNAKKQKVKALIDANTGYGFVLAGLSQVLKPTVKSLIEARQNIISDFIATLKDKVPDLSLPVQGEATKDLFSSESDAFQKSAKYMGIAIGVLVFLGLIYECIGCCWRKTKVVPIKEETIQESMEILSNLIKDVNENINDIVDSMESKHAIEILDLVNMKESYERKVANIGKKEVERRLKLSMVDHKSKRARKYGVTSTA